MHYAFDMWISRAFPGCPSGRYADDVIVHCDTKGQARNLRAAIADRPGSLGLELHPVKTKIVYCKDANRRGDYEHTSFDFLGCTFRARKALGRRGYFSGFGPAISAAAKKAKGKQIRDWHLNRRSGTDLPGLAREINPIVRGWVSYYGAFCRSELFFLAWRINHHLTRQAMRKFQAQVRQSHGLAAEGLPVRTRPVRPLAACRIHYPADCGGRMTGDRHVRS